MKKFSFLIILFFICIGTMNSAFAKEVYTDSKDPLNSSGAETSLAKGGSFQMLKSDTKDFNGMDFNIFMLDCSGEDYLETGSKKEYALKGNGEFIYNTQIGKYEKIEHKGIIRENYSAMRIECSYECDDEECEHYGDEQEIDLFKAYSKAKFNQATTGNFCADAIGYFRSLYELELIRDGSTKREYYVYKGMPVGIPTFSLVTSIDPGNGDLWVATFEPDQNTGFYNAGVYQAFDSVSPHIKNTAAKLTSIEQQTSSSTVTFSDVSDKVLKGLMYYDGGKVAGNIYRYFWACNECSTCERCITGRYDNINSYVAYGEIPEFYLSRGCPLHSCAFVYDYPVSLPDEFEGIKCPDLKIEGDKYLACKAHTCQRWLDNSDYRETFSPQSCLRVIAGNVVTGTESGMKDVRYTGPVDEGVIDVNGSLKLIDGGYSNYCANHMCNAFMCDSPREDSESYSSKYDKRTNEVTMANKYCTSHRSGCKVVCNYTNLPVYNNSYTIIEQIEKAKSEGKYKFCNSKVTQSFYAFVQPDAMICESCYNLMGEGKLNNEGSKKSLNVISTCGKCGNNGVAAYSGPGGAACATCIDFSPYFVSARDSSNYTTPTKGNKKDEKCEFYVQRFAGDTAAICGEKCVKNRRYCYWHLCDTDECANPIKYNGTYFCKVCCPDPIVKAATAELVPSSTGTSAVYNPVVDSGVINDINGTITSSELLAMLKEGEGARFTFKGEEVELSSTTLLSILNMLDHECNATVPQAVALVQIALNSFEQYGIEFTFRSTFATASSGDIYSAGGGTKYDKVGSMNYSQNALDAVADVLSNGSVSREVASIIKDSTQYAGIADREQNNYYVEALESYIASGKAFSIEGTILDCDARYYHEVFGEVYPGTCGTCKSSGRSIKFLDCNGKCFVCDK